MRLITQARRAARRWFPDGHRRWTNLRAAALRARAAAVLSNPQPPDCSDAERAYVGLQERYEGVAEYGYDSYSTWKRGLERARTILEMIESLRTPGARILDAGCGDGMTGAIFAHYGHHVTLADTEDWRDRRATSLPFLACDLCDSIPCRSDAYDFAFSFNGFEHFLDPRRALTNLILACRAGGSIYLDFAPVYTGPWGLHAYRSLRMPYPQFLFSDGFVRDRLRETGIRDLGRSREFLQPLNRLGRTAFMDLWADCGCQVVQCAVDYVDVGYLSVITEYPKSFSGRGLTVDDVLIQGFRVLLRK